MKEIKVGLKGYKYLNEALKLANELCFNIYEGEIILNKLTCLTYFKSKNSYKSR